MLIEYCDKCGMRIPEKEIQEGRAVRMDERLYCAKCCPAPATKAMPKTKHTSEAKIVLAAPRPAQPISDGSLKAHARGARAHDPRSGRTVRQEGLSKPMLAGILAAVAGVLLLAMIFMGGSKPDQAHNTRPDVPGIPKAGENPSSASSAVKTPAVRKPDPPRTATVVPPNGASLPAPAGSSREDLAEKAYVALLAESAGRTVNSRKAKLREFIDTYQDTIVAARARVELARLESPQAGTVANPVAALPPLPDGKTYVLQEGLNGYAGCEDTTLYEVNPTSSRGNRHNLSLASVFAPLVRFKIFKADGGPLPDDARIVSAKLSLYRTDGDSPTPTVHAVLRPWSEAEATWNQAAAGQAWSAPGAKDATDRDPAPLASFKMDRGEQWVEFDVTADFQAGGRKGKQGWLVYTDRNLVNGVSIRSKEYDGDPSQRPKLTLVLADAVKPAPVAAAGGKTYVLQQGLDGYAGCEDTFLYIHHPKVSKNKEIELSCGRDMVPVLRFAIFKSEGGPVPDGAQIVSAKLDLERPGGDRMGLNVYPVLKDCQVSAATWEEAAPGLAWDEAGAASKGKDYGSEPLATLPVGRDMTALEFDLTEGVRKLAGGEKNRGWVLHGDRNKWNYYRISSSENAEADKRPKLTVVVAGDAAVAAAPTDGLVLYLPFDEKEGTVAKDASGANNNGQISGGVMWVEGNIGGALRLDGTSGRVDLRRLAVDTKPGGRTTVAFWVKSEFPDSMVFCWAGLGDLLFARGNFGFNTYNSDILGVSTDLFKAKSWNHVVAVFPNELPSESNARLYVNGNRMSISNRLAQLPSNAMNATEDATIGAYHAKSEYFFKGEVDEFRIYNRELSDAEAAALYAAGSGVPAPPAPPKAGGLADGLVLHLPFDDQKDRTAKDASGANNNAQIEGSPEWVAGKIGGALYLNGRDCRVVLGRLAVNAQSGAKNTVAMWVRFGQLENMLFSWAGRGALYFGRGNFGFNTQSSDILGIPCTDLAVHQWTHLVAVFPNDLPNDQNATLYVNGKRVAIAHLVGRPSGPSQATSDATIGVMFKPTIYHIDATVDDFRIYNRELSEAEVAALYAAGGKTSAPPVDVATPAPVAADGLVLHMPFNRPGAEFNQDLSGRECKVEFKNGATALTTARGYALNLAKGNSYAKVEGVAVDTRPGAKNTATFWMYPREIDNAMPFAWKERPYCLYLHTKGFGFNTGEAGNILGVDGSRIKPKEWVHVAAVFPNGKPDLSNIALYLDGKRVEPKLVAGAMPALSRSASNGIYLGNLPDGKYPFSGNVSDVRVYNYELSAEEVQAVFENKPLPPRSTAAPAPVADKDLVLYLPFDEKSGDVAKDASGHGHDAALKGGPQFAAGKIGGALKFDGADDCAEIPDFDYGPEFTLAFWFNMDQRPGARFQYLFGHGVYDKTNTCLVYVDQEEKKIRTYLRDGNDGNTSREYDIPFDGLGNWIHYAVQVSREEGLEIFLDGKLLKTGRHGKKGVYPQTSMTLGIRWDFDRERIFKGALDDLRLYNRALSDEEIAALAEGNAPAIAAAPTAAAPQLSAEDKALDERLKRWRVLWGAGETKSLKDDIEALRKAGGAGAEQAAVCEAALAARDAAWKQAAALVGKSVRLAMANGETQAGKIERLDGDRFEFNLGGLVTRLQLGDLAWETFSAWAGANLAGDAEKQKKLAAAALLTAGVDAEKEAGGANLGAAWATLLASAGRVDADLKNDAVWAEILGLVKAQKWQEVYGKSQGLLDAPPGGLLSAELKEKVEKLLAESKASIQAEVSKPENLPLQVRAKALGDGKLELRYDFSNPRQLQDWEGMDAAFMRIEGGALNLSAMQIRHKLSFEGDLTISYEAASTATKPHRLCTAFYDLRGEIGFEGKDETAFWHALNQPGKTVKTNPLVGKQWNRVDIQFTAATKQTRIAVNGTECMSSANPNSAGKGHVLLAAYHPYLVRNLVISGKPAPDASEAILRNRAFVEALQKKLAQGETVTLFTAEDQGNWDMGFPDNWRFASGVANGEGTLLLPGLALRDYEAEMNVRLYDADKLRVVVRQGPKDLHYALVTPRGVSVYATDRLANYAGKEVGKPNNADGKAWHHLTVQSKGSALKIVLDGKEVLFDDLQVGTDSLGFYFQTEGGKAAIKDVKVKALR